jgi:D-amino-acid oxidase
VTTLKSSPLSNVDAVVIGAGVSGLTTAVCLAEAGAKVGIVSAEPPLRTTSAAAGAMWGPYLVEPADKAAAWSMHSLGRFRRLAQDQRTGVRFVPGVEASRLPAAPPPWAGHLDEFRMCDPDELPQGFVAGWRFTAALIDMPTYLAYLVDRFITAGGSLQQRHIDTLDAAAELAPVVINCTGTGARALVPDPDVTAIRGQLVVLTNPGISEFFTEATGRSPQLLHIYPHGDTVIVGGQAATDNWDLEPDPAVAKAILARGIDVEPRLGDAQVIGHRVGLRPTRPTVRVEIQQCGATKVVHNYGHGGAGVTLSWGCAHEVVDVLSSQA